MAETVATGSAGTGIIRSESPEGPIYDDLVFTILDDGGGGEEGSRRDPHHPVTPSPRQGETAGVQLVSAEARASGRPLCGTGDFRAIKPNLSHTS